MGPRKRKDRGDEPVVGRDAYFRYMHGSGAISEEAKVEARRRWRGMDKKEKASYNKVHICRDYSTNDSVEIESLKKEKASYNKAHICRDDSTNDSVEIESLKNRLSLLQQELEHAKHERYLAYERVEEMKSLLYERDLRILEGEEERKRQHNEIQELKGKIRVFCRVRPLTPQDAGMPVISCLKSTGIEVVNRGQKTAFEFDKVFPPETSQEDVFVEISQLVQSALDGYKVCIFAYGQTGSGKTYTMMGRPDAPDQKGLIPRSMEQIFQSSQSLRALGWVCKIQVSMFEIYNENVRDLIFPSSTSGAVLSRREGSARGKKYALRIVEVACADQISSLLQQATLSRAVGKTQMNDQSSRSHFVLTVRISGGNETTGHQFEGILNLVDLAGSERVSKSGATGERLAETQAINSSLTHLSNVISALAKKDKYVPFRTSTLTHILEPCLSEGSKALMLVNVAPNSESASESLCSLRFASRVSACEIGSPQMQKASKPSFPHH